MASAPRIGQRLEMRQGQALVMTPQLQQAIKLLQLSNLELAEFIEGELERNPLLERQEPESQERERAESGEAEGLSFDNAGSREADLDVDASVLHPDMSAGDLADAGAPPLVDWSKAQSGKSFDEFRLDEHDCRGYAQAQLTDREPDSGGSLQQHYDRAFVQCMYAKGN